MSDELSNATRIAALEEHVRQLTADVTRECDRRIEETERLRCELDGQEATRKFRAAELHAVRLALADRNAYAERLVAENVRLSNDLAAMHTFLDKSKALCGDWQMAVMLAVPHGTVWDAANPKAMVQTITAENVRLSNEAAFMRSFINNEDVRSDFQTVTQMRQALDRERERVREWNVLVAQGCTPGGSEFHDSPANVARYLKDRDESKDHIIKWKQKELNTEHERCGVLEAEVLAWHAAEHLRKDEPHNEFMRLAEARFRTRETHALDAAKFVGGGQ